MAEPHVTITPNAVTGGSPYRAVLRLATPTVLAMLTQSIVNEVDIVFFSWLPCPESSNAQAALFPSLILLWLFGGSLSAISVGTQAMAARRFARSQHGEAGGVLVNSWVVAAASGVVFTAVGYAALPAILGLLIKVPAVRDAAEAYLEWRLLGIASMVLTFSFKSFFDGIGKTHVHMVSAIVMNALNVVLCLIFIFGRLGAPRMGIAGAGMAGFVSTWVGLFIMVGWALRPHYRTLYRPFALSSLDRALAWRIVKLSAPSAIATIAVMSGFALFSMIVSHLDSLQGSQTVNPKCPEGTAEAVNSAATTVIVGILKLTFTACLAFGTSTATLVSQSLGEGDAKKAATFGWVSVRLGIGIFGLVGIVEGLLFPESILSFVSESPAVVDAALIPMRIMGICTPIIAVAMILTQALFGAGNTRFVMVTELVLHFTCLVPLAWVFGITLGFGLVGIWSAAVVYVTLLGAVMAAKFHKGDWQRIEI